MIERAVLKVFAFLVVWAVLFVIAAWPLSLCWNWVVPILWPAAPRLGMLEAWGLMFVTRCLIGEVVKVEHGKK